MMLKLLVAALMAGGMASPSSAQSITSLPAENLPWSKTEEGAEFAALEGDRFTEAYMAMVRLPAGLASPVHIKSANMFGVVVEGTFVHLSENADRAEVPLGPGAYYMILAGLPHTSKCISRTPCTAFLYQDGAFDFVPLGQ
ncbi:MAG: DUF4437 domain-containing protein [Hyphomicrobiales bacterium]|nr:DUF4437 domain-containing protein [Hyphomicrobiales bacterium]